MNVKESLTNVLVEIATTLDIKRPLAVLDVETTGTWRGYDRIVQIAFVTVTPNKQVSECSYLINPEILISTEATAIHGITNASVAKAPTFIKIAPLLIKALSGHDFIGYNFRFDRNMLESEFARINEPFPFAEATVIDPLRIWQWLEPRTLSDAVEYFYGISPDETHRADADINTTARVLVGQLRKHRSAKLSDPSVQVLSKISHSRDENWLDSDGRLRWRDGAARFNFGKHTGSSLQDIFETHPDYLKWILKQDFPTDLKEIISKVLEGNYPEEPKLNTDHQQEHP